MTTVPADATLDLPSARVGLMVAREAPETEQDRIVFLIKGLRMEGDAFFFRVMGIVSRCSPFLLVGGGGVPANHC